MKQFTTAVREKTQESEGDDKPITFDVDGQTFTAYKPSDAQIAIITTKTGRRASSADVAAAAIDFFWSVLDDKAARTVEDRLMDRKDDFGLDEVLDILFWLIEEWTGHPTERQSVSTV